MKGFTLVELLIVMAIIASLIAAFVPVGINEIKFARATTIALDLSEISKAAMSNFYFDHNLHITINSVKSYFSPQMYQNLKKFKISSSLSSSVEHVYIWYDGNDINASQVKKVFPEVVATQSNKPMISIKLKKYW